MSFVGILTVPFRPLFKKYDESAIFLHLFSEIHTYVSPECQSLPVL